jgi:hypothetical protein
MKHRILPVSATLVFALLRGEQLAYRVIKNEMPEDAKLVNVRHGWPDTIELLIESETFEDIPEGAKIPFFVPEFESVQ